MRVRFYEVCITGLDCHCSVLHSNDSNAPNDRLHILVETIITKESGVLLLWGWSSQMSLLGRFQHSMERVSENP